MKKMKKIIGVLVLLVAFTINANAQDKNESSAYDLGKRQAAELSKFLGLNKDVSEALSNLFEQKITVNQDKNMSEERKVEFSRVVEAKIRATLDQDQMEKLEKNKALYEKIIH